MHACQQRTSKRSIVSFLVFDGDKMVPQHLSLTLSIITTSFSAFSFVSRAYDTVPNDQVNHAFALIPRSSLVVVASHNEI